MPDENTWIIHNAIRSRADAYYSPAKDKYLLFSSYLLTEAKGARKAIVAFAKSGMAGEAYTLKLMGNCSNDYKESLLKTVNNYGVSQNIEFVPFQYDVKPFFTKATAYLMTSDYEALGRVTAEAMFYGCPVIAHATGGSLDLIKHEETGYLYQTVDECAELIKHVCATSQDSVIRKAQDFVVNNLSQEAYGPKIMEIYKKVLES